MPVPFRNRADAGQQLATHLSQYRDRSDVIVLGLPGAAFQSPPRSPRHSTRPSMPSLSVSSASPAMKSWPWAPSHPADCAS